jgi:hypothetical protein
MTTSSAFATYVPINGLNHPVFATDLAAGVAAVARAIGVRQAGDLVRVLDENAPVHHRNRTARSHLSGWRLRERHP